MEAPHGPDAPSAHVCPVDAVVDVIGGKWKLRILWRLSQRTHRYGGLRRAIPEISEKMLYQQLRQLEADGLVRRTAYPEVPPRVDYALTARGRSLVPVLNEVAAWGVQHLADRLARPEPED